LPLAARVAADVSVNDHVGVATLLTTIRHAGAEEAFSALATRAASGVTLDDPKGSPCCCGNCVKPGPAGPGRPPDRTSLDVQVEGVELELRRVIADTLAEEPEALPPHVSGRINERIATALRRNPGPRSAHHDSPSGKLEYRDLRELQDVLTSKTLCPRFEARPGSKEMLNVRFAQLAELRNGLRHSRTVDDVTRKDGEVAIIWFRQVLAHG
jgi:hypothetical protein